MWLVDTVVLCLGWTWKYTWWPLGQVWATDEIGNEQQTFDWISCLLGQERREDTIVVGELRVHETEQRKGQKVDIVSSACFTRGS